MAVRIVGVLVLFGAALVVGGISAGQAQVTQGTTVLLTAAIVQALALDTNTVDFGTVGQAEYDQGFAEKSPAQNVTVKSNVPWQLNVRADTATWSYTPPAGMTIADPNKPTSDLEWRATSSDSRVTTVSGTYAGMATTDAQVAAGNRGANIQLQTHFRVLLDYAQDPAGDYQMTITYTLTTQ